ncbi:MAG: DUF4834 family protein [Prevotella sp.]|nr:DUF4834 family protein [Prevotella sp.]
MQFFLSLIGFIFLLFTCGMAVIVWKVHKRMRDIRDVMQEQMQDEEFLRKADKNYFRKKRDQGPMFDEEYFKGDPLGKRKKQEEQASGQQRSTRRTTRTAGGVTIIDDRAPEKRDKKIFAQDEGEYVDFKEE